MAFPVNESCGTLETVGFSLTCSRNSVLVDPGLFGVGLSCDTLGNVGTGDCPVKAFQAFPPGIGCLFPVDTGGFLFPDGGGLLPSGC